jgi:hypothetical protein
MAFPIRPFSECMIPHPLTEPLWAFAARSAGNRAWAVASRAGGGADECMAAYEAAYAAVEEASS